MIKIISYTTALCFHSSCSNLPDTSDAQLVGIWKESCGKSKTIILRNPDRTYFQKSLRGDSVSGLKVDTCSGEWDLRGDVYSEKLTSVSNKNWEKFIGKKFKMEVTSVSPSIFLYYSTDNAACEQIKLGAADIDLFSKIRIELIQGDR